MEINELAAVGHGLATAIFAALAILLLGRWKDRPKAPLIAAASGVTVIWAATQAVGSLGQASRYQGFVVCVQIDWRRRAGGYAL